MSSSKKKSAANQAVAGGGDSSMFDITLDQLKELMNERGEDLMRKLNSSEYNGVKGVLQKLKVDGDKGLYSNNEQDLEQRRTAYGRNIIPPKPLPSLFNFCWHAFDFQLKVTLLVCAVVSIGLSFYTPINLAWLIGVAILVVIFVIGFNDWRKERQFRVLNEQAGNDRKVLVIRDNGIQILSISELVVGDICDIRFGDILPADGLVVQSNDLSVDESSLTGEADVVKKSEKEDVRLLSGTQVMEGSVRMVVVGVGLNTQVGSIVTLLSNYEEKEE